MPRLAGSYDLTSDPRVDMQIAQSIGDAIGSGLRNHSIRQEEARKQHLNATLVETLGRTIKDGVTDPGKILEAIESVPDYAESQWYQQMVMDEAQRRMGTTSKYGVMPGTYQHLTPEEQRKASLISAGIEPRVGAAVNEPDPMTAVIEGYNAIQNTDLPPELKQQLFNRNLGQLWLQAMGGPYRTPGFDTQPKGLPFGVSPDQYAAANRAEIERKIKGSSGGRRVIDFWDKDGNKRKKLINDDNFNDVIQSIIESGGRLEEDSLTKELSYWQTALQKTLDPLGYVLPGQEETAALANERISLLRDLIRGKSLPAEQPQLQGDMTEQQADTALKEIMSPEAYQQAKATGIPATELLQSVMAYLQQNKTVNNNPAQQSEKTEVDNSEKTEVNNQDENLRKEFNSMLEGGSFAEYRKLFAAGIPQKQIEEAYKNDPFVPANNSKLAEPGYKPKTKLRTWEELTDYQRERAYQLYLDQNKLPLGDRFGMAVAKVISKSDYENYKKKKKEHESKLLTKEQFAKKAQNDNEFLWKFVKISNQTGPVKINQAEVDVHRALDSQRLPVFRGL